MSGASPQPTTTTSRSEDVPSQSVTDGAACRVCGASLKGQRCDARYCSPACRREAARYRAVLAGKPAGPYSTIGQLQNRRQRRANGLLARS